MDGEHHERETESLHEAYLLRGWTALAGLLGILFLLCATYDRLTDDLRTEPDVLSNPPVFRLDINTATAAQLRALPEVGVALADRIVQHRTEHGPFDSVAGLQAVRGVGPTRISRLKDMLTVSSVESLQNVHLPVNQLSSNGSRRN